jgi:hypothetical protein
VFLVVSFLLAFPPISIPRPHSCYMPCPDSFLIIANSSINIDTYYGAVKQTTERIYIRFPVNLIHSERKRGDMLQLRRLYTMTVRFQRFQLQHSSFGICNVQSGTGAGFSSLQLPCQSFTADEMRYRTGQSALHFHSPSLRTHLGSATWLGYE